MEAEAPVQEDEDVYADMPALIPIVQLAPSIFMLYDEQGTFLTFANYVQDEEEKRKSEALDLAQALMHIADLESVAEELEVGDEDADYISGEPLVKGQHGFVLDDCRNAPILRESLRQLLEVHRRFKNPMTNQPIVAVYKVLFV